MMKVKVADKTKTDRATTSGEWVPAAYNPGWLRTTTAETLGIIEQLSSYLTFLEDARDQKSKVPNSAPGFEREVLAQARLAEHNTRRLLGGTLRIVQHLDNSGFVDYALRHWTNEIGRRGPITFAQQWQSLLDDKEVVARFNRAGVSNRTLQRLSSAAGQLTQPIEVRDGKLAVTGTKGITVTLQRRSLLGGTIADLLFINQFNTAAGLFERTDVPPGVVVRHSHDHEEIHVDPLEAILAVATRAQRTATAHVRKIEDTGLAVYAGHEAATIIIVIVAVTIIATILVAVICEKTDADGEVCDLVQSIIAGLGFASAAIVCSENPDDCDITVAVEASRSSLSDGSFAFIG